MIVQAEGDPDGAHEQTHAERYEQELEGRRARLDGREPRGCHKQRLERARQLLVPDGRGQLVQHHDHDHVHRDADDHELEVVGVCAAVGRQARRVDEPRDERESDRLTRDADELPGRGHPVAQHDA